MAFLAKSAGWLIFLEPMVLSPATGLQTFCKYAAHGFEGGWPRIPYPHGGFFFLGGVCKSN
jgi:hypothetical protein